MHAWTKGYIINTIYKAIYLPNLHAVLLLDTYNYNPNTAMEQL